RDLGADELPARAPGRALLGCARRRLHASASADARDPASGRARARRDRVAGLHFRVERVSVRVDLHRDRTLSHRAGRDRAVPGIARGALGRDRGRIVARDRAGLRARAAIPTAHRRGADGGSGEGLARRSVDRARTGRSMAAIEFDRVSKRFGQVTVLEDLRLTIEEGEFFTFVGPSGCGKSTTLSLIAGLERPTSGRIRFAGEPVDHLAPRDRDVAMVFQSYALYPHMSVAENIGFPLK